MQTGTPSLYSNSFFSVLKTVREHVSVTKCGKWYRAQAVSEIPFWNSPELPSTIGQTLQTLSRSLCLSQSQSKSNCTQPIRRFSSHSQSAALTPDWKGCVLEKYSRDVNTVVLYTVCCWYVNATKINIECGCMFVCSCSDRDVPGSRPNVCVQLFTSQRKAFVYICLGHFLGAVFEFCDALPFSNGTAC